MHKKPRLTPEERTRRKRELVVITLIIIVVAFLTFMENKLVHFGPEFPVSNAIMMFILININLLLLILLIFLVLRNLVKLYYDRRHKVMGASLRTRLLMAFIALTLLPSTILFFFSIQFITTSIAFWFNVPVEQTLENSLEVGQRLYQHIEENSRFFLERAAYQIKTRKLIQPPPAKSLGQYIFVIHKEFNLNAVEVYAPTSERLAIAHSDTFAPESFPLVTMEHFQKLTEETSVTTLSEEIHQGELIRTLGTIPFGVNSDKAVGFLVISKLIPSDLSQNLAAISQGVSEYRQIKLLKRPIQITYYMTLSIVALLVVFCAIWFAFYIAKSITIPIMQLAEGTRKVAEGDLTFNINFVADDEIGSLIDSYNKMRRDLAASREQLALSDKQLRKQNIEIEERRQYMEIVLKNVAAGVISIDTQGFIKTINKSAERMLAIQGTEIIGKSYKKLLQGQHLKLASEITEKIGLSKDGVNMPLSLTIEGRPRTFMVHFNGLTDDKGEHVGLVLVFDDLTELEKAQRMLAWREVARRIAHEVKNPLTPITLSAQRLQRKFSKTVDDPIFDECASTIITHVELIRNLVNEFAIFARFPNANPTLEDLPSIIKDTVALYNEGHKHIRFDYEIAENIPKIDLDREQIKRALINILDNAITAMKKQGQIKITLTYDDILKIVQLEIADTGCGISDEEKTRLFEPYFSTKKSGMGLGLAIVSSIIADHKGMIRVQDNPPHGAKFIIEFPVLNAPNETGLP